MSRSEIQEALRSLIRGDGVTRASHSLTLEREDTTPEFLRLLEEEGYHALQVDDIVIEPGEKVPAFSVRDRTAHFGWVFWEAFFPGRMRKIFGSVRRNRKGDWAIIIGKGRKDKVYANITLRQGMDVDHPSEF